MKMNGKIAFCMFDLDLLRIAARFGRDNVTHALIYAITNSYRNNIMGMKCKKEPNNSFSSSFELATRTRK